MSDLTDPGPSDHASAVRGDDGSEDDFYRSGGAVATRPTALPLPRLEAIAGARPPAWAFYPLFLLGALGGLFVFSAAREVLGDGVLPVLLALSGGIVVLAGTVLIGGLLLSYVEGSAVADPR